MRNSYFLIIALLFLSACGILQQEDTASGTGTGSLAFNVTWVDAPTLQVTASKLATPNSAAVMMSTPVDCTAAGISTISAVLYDSSGNAVATGGPWNCSTHQGTLSKIPAGSNRTGVIFGKDSSGNVRYCGEQTGITITANQTTTSDIIVASFTPANVSATAGDKHVTISWASVTGATSYNIYWSTTTGVTTANGTKITGATSPYSHTVLTNGTTYYYIVTAVNLGGESPASSQVSAVPQLITFGAATNFPVESNPQSVAIGDFNADGKLDLAVANRGSGTVSILLGSGNGSFGAATNFTVGASPVCVAIGDFNGDGNPDLAVANLTSYTVSILLGSGTGTFGAATNFTVGTNPYSVAIGDLNGDGKLDLAVANSYAYSSSVSVLLGTGNGSFGAATNFSAGTEPISIAIGDFNGDSKPDLAVADYSGGSNNVSILLGIGNGSFGAATKFTAGGNAKALAIGDLNVDGKLDLAVANETHGNVSVLLGNGNGTFGPATNYSVGTAPQSVAIGDLNGDGTPDLAVVSGSILILLGTGTGTFGTASYFSPGGPGSIALGDLNGDGKPDLAVANYTSNNVSILLNQ